MDNDTEAALDDVVRAAAALAGLEVSSASLEAVRLHLRNSLSIAEAIGPVGPEAAPVFKA